MLGAWGIQQEKTLNHGRKKEKYMKDYRAIFYQREDVMYYINDTFYGSGKAFCRDVSYSKNERKARREERKEEAL